MPRPSALTDPNGPRWPDRHPHNHNPVRKGHHTTVPDAWVAWMHECDRKKGYLVCGRRNRFDEPCEQRPPSNARVDGADAFGRPPCHSHGGKSLSGIANSAYKTGEYVKQGRYAVSGKLAAYNERLLDHDYLSLHEEIVLTERLIQECVEVLDDPTPCPEPWPEPPLPAGQDGKYSPEAQERNGRIMARNREIEQWHAVRAQATARYDSLMATLATLKRTEIARVKQAQDTLAGGAVRLFANKLLEVNRRRWLEFGRRHNVPVEEVLHALAQLQEDFVTTITHARNTGARRGASEVS